MVNPEQQQQEALDILRDAAREHALTGAPISARAFQREAEAFPADINPGSHAVADGLRLASEERAQAQQPRRT